MRMSLPIARAAVFEALDRKPKKGRGWKGLARIIAENAVIKSKTEAKNIVRNFLFQCHPKVWEKFSKDFWRSEGWRRLRYETIKRHGAKCQCCGRNPRQDGIKLHVDHIKPRSEYPELALDPDNLQVLCEDCNLGKLDRDTVDWR